MWCLESLRSLESGVWSHSGVWSLRSLVRVWRPRLESLGGWSLEIRRSLRSLEVTPESGVTPESECGVETLRSLECGVWSYSGVWSLESGVTPESGVWSLESLRSLEFGITLESGVWSLESLRSLESGIPPESGVWSLESLRDRESGV